MNQDEREEAARKLDALARALREGKSPEELDTMLHAFAQESAEAFPWISTAEDQPENPAPLPTPLPCADACEREPLGMPAQLEQLDALHEDLGEFVRQAKAALADPKMPYHWLRTAADTLARMDHHALRFASGMLRGRERVEASRELLSVDLTVMRLRTRGGRGPSGGPPGGSAPGGRDRWGLIAWLASSPRATGWRWRGAADRGCSAAPACAWRRSRSSRSCTPRIERSSC